MLHLDRAITILANAGAPLWFPHLRCSPQGAIYLSVQHGWDAHFAPFREYRSTDRGRTWQGPTQTVPRLAWWHCFADGERVDIDFYAVPDAMGASSVAAACWSHPGDPGHTAEHGFARFHVPALADWAMTGLAGYPSFPWRQTWQAAGREAEFAADTFLTRGPCLTGGMELPDGRLAAAGYWQLRGARERQWGTVIVTSADRGRTWTQAGLLNLHADLDVSETSLICLADGRWYAVCRVHDGTPRPLHHAWSRDEGKSWTPLAPIRLQSGATPAGHVWPELVCLANGWLVLTCGRPGKHLYVDPSGTGEQWQYHVDLHRWELETQEVLGVAPEQRLRGVVEAWPDGVLERQTDSGDYLSMAEIAPNELRIVYDVQHFVEDWNAAPVVSAVRMVKLKVNV